MTIAKKTIKSKTLQKASLKKKAKDQVKPKKDLKISKAEKPKKEIKVKKAAKPKKEKSIEENLWDSAIKLRGSVEPSEYKHIVLSLIFLKFASDKFQEVRNKLKNKKYLEVPEYYKGQSTIFIPEKSRWEYIMKISRQADISIKLDEALENIEKKNESKAGENNIGLKGALPVGYFARLRMDTNKLSALLSAINNINTLKDKEQDLVGRVYEYFLSKFAIAEGKGKGEFYTPKCIVNLMAEMLEPYEGNIYDPACGSGGMFVQSLKFIEKHKGDKKNVLIYGQESITTTFKLAKMNLAIRGIKANLGEVAADTFGKDQHPDLEADYIMANPPFNLSDWRAPNELKDDSRWDGYDTPPASNANYAWILNMVAKLSKNGVAGFILANGALSGMGEEYKIRKRLIENKLVEAIIIIPRNTFYSTDISVTLWILNKNKKERTVKINNEVKKYREREDEILFMDLRRWGSDFEKQFIQLTNEDITKVASNYHNWQQTDYKKTYKNVPEYCYSAKFKEIQDNDFSLVPSKYIKFIDHDSKIDFDTEMKRIQKDFKVLLNEEKQSQAQLINAFKTLGYEL